MTSKALQRILTKAQKIATCEREISELVEMIGLLNMQISNCHRILQELQYASGRRN